jgi:hypothetical protein
MLVKGPAVGGIVVVVGDTGVLSDDTAERDVVDVGVVDIVTVVGTVVVVDDTGVLSDDTGVVT